MKIKWDYNSVRDYIHSKGDTLLSDEYKNNRTKLDIMCKNNHKFEMTFHDYKDGNCRCGICYKENREVTKEYVITYLKEYGYELVGDYKNTQEKIAIKCPNGHLTQMAFCQFKNNGHRCKYCVNNNIKLSYGFVKDIMEKSGYTLLDKEYINNTHKMNVMCPSGHKIKMSWALFNMGVRCNECSCSSGESEIYTYLKKHNINFIPQYSFIGCKDKRTLPFDFYIPEKNICIEFDGEQHYAAFDYLGGEEGFNTRRRHDEIKNNYCKDNNIELIRIPYYDFNNIDNILDKIL